MLNPIDKFEKIIERPVKKFQFPREYKNANSLPIKKIVKNFLITFTS